MLWLLPMDGIKFSVNLKEISSLEGTLFMGSIIPNIEMLYGDKRRHGSVF